ncbi:hypothetical protein ATCC90586_004330 [Pythium insidiosum]|nr:hypothetical protein ATCC90586_004330 [Pythium insidiosum]
MMELGGDDGAAVLRREQSQALQSVQPIESLEEGIGRSSQRDPLLRGSTTTASLRGQSRRRTRSNEDATASVRSDRDVMQRWRLFVGALLFLTQVFVEIGRRGLRLIELNVPRYIAFVDRCLVHIIRVTVHPRKQVSALRLLLVLIVIASVPYILVTLYRMQSAARTSHSRRMFCYGIHRPRKELPTVNSDQSPPQPDATAVEPLELDSFYLVS